MFNLDPILKDFNLDISKTYDIKKGVFKSFKYCS